MEEYMKKKNIDRNLKFKPWKTLIPFQVPEEAKRNGVVAVFQNNHVTVFIKETESPAFTTPDGASQKIAHLMLQWAKGLKGSDDYFYGLKQRIKRELCGEQSEAIELFPADWREQKFNQTHLWAMFQGATFPIGILPADLDKAMADMAGGRENVIIKQDLELFVVRHDDKEIIEVFESEEECKNMYGDNNIPERSICGIELIGNIPLESPTVAWTDRAKAKLANVMAKGEAATRSIEKAPELFSEVDTLEDDIFDKEIPRDMDDGDPVGLEEDLAIAGAMEEALGNKAEDRAKQVREISEEITGKTKKSLDDIRNSSEKPKIIIP
jgi:hypothetical protein